MGEINGELHALIVTGMGTAAKTLMLAPSTTYICVCPACDRMVLAAGFCPVHAFGRFRQVTDHCNATPAAGFRSGGCGIQLQGEGSELNCKTVSWYACAKLLEGIVGLAVRWWCCV